MNVVERNTNSMIDIRRMPRRKRRQRVNHNAPSKHPPAAQPIGQISAQQSKNSTRHRRHKEQHPRPKRKLFAARLDAKLHQRRPKNQRQHQQFIDIERKPDRRNDADQPLHERQPRRTMGEKVPSSVFLGS